MARMPPIPQADFPADGSVNASVRWLAHQAQRIADALRRNHSYVFRVAELARQRVLHRSVKNWISGTVFKIGDEHPVARAEVQRSLWHSVQPPAGQCRHNESGS